MHQDKYNSAKKKKQGKWNAPSKKVQEISCDSSNIDEQFEHLSFSEISVHSVMQDTRDEVYAKINIKLPEKPNVSADLQVKVDTGAKGNILPRRIYQRMCQSKVDCHGMPIPGYLEQRNVILSAYNGTPIKHYGVVRLPCNYSSSDWSTTEFYIAETTGPAILGLPSSRELKLITLNCEIHSSSAPITSTEDLVKLYPSSFDRIGNFPGTYHIVVDQHVLPVIHAPRKCPIQMRDEIISEIDSMVQQGVIKKVEVPTDWVSSLAYSRKANGKLHICLDPKDLNRAIKRCHHRTRTLEELTHRFAGAQYFSKLDAKNGYWSVKLDEESQLLTTFNSPFGRYCFMRMPFGLVMSQDVFQQKMDQIFKRCPGTVGIADDVAVFGRTEAEHDANLHNLMKVATESGLMFNSQKCSIKQNKINFFWSCI